MGERAKEEEEKEKGYSMNAVQSRNVVAIIQKEPFYYLNFGVYWWHIKRELKRQGYGPDQLHHLGDYEDTLGAEYLNGQSVKELDIKAFEYQWDHTFDMYNQSRHLTPDGEVYFLHDEDAE